MPTAAAEIFHRAAELNASDPRREGNVVRLQEGAELIVAGDLHGNRAGLVKIIAHADLDHQAHRCVVFQELGHGPVDPATGHDRSAELLLRAARLKVQHPRQVLFVLGNHDVAQVTGSEIMKGGRGVCRAFAAGVNFAFGGEGPEVLSAIEKFLLSMPLAIRCPNGVLISHSLPSPSRMKLAGTEILSRPYRDEDLRRGGPVYEWTWGRNQTAEQLDELAAKLGVEFFILGHHHADSGFEMLSPRGMVVMSDHEHGCIVEFVADLALTAEMVGDCVKPIAALGASA